MRSDDAARVARFEQLYDSCATDVALYVTRRAASPEDAADIVAEAFAVAWRRIDEVPADNERAWLFCAARNLLSNAARRARSAHEVTTRLANDLRTVTRPERTQAADEALDAIDSLPAVDRELVMLTVWDGLSVKEAAEVVGLSHGTARVRLHRARSRLRVVLEGLRSAASPIVS